VAFGALWCRLAGDGELDAGYQNGSLS
jgi:hypothetical protein